MIFYRFSLLLGLVLLCHIPYNEVDAAFELYNTDNQMTGNALYYDCLLYNALYGIRITMDVIPSIQTPAQLLRYCIRPGDETKNRVRNQVEGNIFQVYTFEQLRDQQHANARILSILSVPVDVIERYQEYLEKPSASSFSAEHVYICNPSWFGSYCQYTFGTDSNSFDGMVKRAFEWKYSPFFLKTIDILQFTNLSCYTHLACDLGPGQFTCLDWREICDGKVHCHESGTDEMGCFELEVNECAENEYRCHNGQCVPEEFYKDNPYDPDCTDSSDENFFGVNEADPGMTFIDCYKDPAFRCEEADHSFFRTYTTCGDGGRSFLHFPLHNLENSCTNNRNTAMTRSLYSHKENAHLSYDCWSLLSCVLQFQDEINCSIFCKNKTNNECKVQLDSKCFTETVLFPSQPVYDGHIRLVYSTNRTIALYTNNKPAPIPDYICFVQKRAPFLQVFEVINNHTCVHILNLDIKDVVDVVSFSRSSVPIDSTGNETHCRHSSLFRCPGTIKCISKHRLVDGQVDCFGAADELFNGSCVLNDRFRFRCTSENKCLSPRIIADGISQCVKHEDEDFRFIRHTDFSFPHICNGYEGGTAPVLVDELEEREETNCEHWPCDNVYTRCDGAWHCPDGADERYCGEPWCEFDQHPCVSVSNHSVICLPLHQVNDGIIDCLGASDEREYCQSQKKGELSGRYRCLNSSECQEAMYVCFALESRCLLDSNIRNACDQDRRIVEILDKLTDRHIRLPIYTHFQLRRPNKSSMDAVTGLLAPRNFFNEKDEDEGEEEISSLFRHAWICNRGVVILVGLNKTEMCLCPPSYYGDRCEKQSQRVSLTVQFQQICNPSCRDAFGVIFTLLDDENEIHSQEQRMYVPTIICANKTNIYLLFNSRSKNASKKYHVRIDAYKKTDFMYHASWILSVPFPFLPVNRMAVRLAMSPSFDHQLKQCSPACGVHGYCTRATNIHESFCRCQVGWAGPQCSVPYICSCSADSLCLGLSTCLCPLHKRGPRCFLNSTCHSKPCQNGALCIPHDDQLFEDRYTCICMEGFSGPTCATINTRIEINIGGSMTIPQLLFAHFITVRDKDNPQFKTIVQKIPADREGVIMYIDVPFHLIFVQIDANYYLTLVREVYTPSASVSSHVVPARRCPHIRELFDAQTVNYPLLRRVKYFHLPCRKQVDLACFRDNEAPLMCICDRDHNANCFQYEFNTTYECRMLHTCENGAKCYQDRLCSLSVLCICPQCYYGTRCQFTTKDIGLSLDAILGYQIRRNISVFRQPVSVKASIAITTIMLFVGLLNGILSVMTFQNRKPREMGCGYYLLTTSITSILTMLMFSYKFLFLLLSQTAFIKHRQSLHINCVAIDFLLRSSLVIGDWLTAAVAIERALTVMKGGNFNKQKSRQMARWVILGIIIVTFVSVLHDPIHRELVDDKEEERTWCLVRYSHPLNIYNSAINMVHFLAPFSINIISAVYIITTIAHMRSTAQNRNLYREHLQEQFRHHKHLLISPIVLVLLSIPRVVITFVSGCMKSGRDPWLFLVGYFISFIPPLLTFIIFVLPSDMYKKEFSAMIKCVRSKDRPYVYRK
jgi:hypothetical protein